MTAIFGSWWRRLPKSLRLPLGQNERSLAQATLAAGPIRDLTADQVILATNQGLWLPTVPTGTGDQPPSTDPVHRRISWHEINRVVWSGSELALTPAVQVAPAEGYVVMADAPTVTYRLVDPDGLPKCVRVRVSRSIAHTEHHQLPGGGGVRVVGRRISGQDGLHWTVRYDPGTDLSRPETVAATAALVALAKAEAAGPVG